MKAVEFYYDLVSPYSYLAYGEVTRMCRERGAELALRPMLLGAVHNATGIQAPIRIESKARYQAKDIRRWAEQYGLPIDFPDPFPFRTLKTMRAAMFLKDRGELEAFTREAFVLYWEEGGAPKGLEEADEDGPVTEVARRVGADPEEVLAGASTPEAKEALKAATSGAVERGVFGAPAFFVGDEMFWGNDRLHFVEAALGRG
ncbi:2-hydroxychromene-2-carboxylate isomerase [Rubrobacter tropicus]|uniref:2-hydroxychromene-2-carboxylate isomerase n=1 Tax=Rubrobacter tropicus TaxID=2653851 RepID=A0A6G8Q6F1_9ACTN|nr:2-hydroxychromene-2-carboxylate isomerase [Rubrobacter tropicus]QIN82064.1 2-hydroxychromene-2-carboxylate isomerase [Rubrobacter tropicus]